MSRVATAAAAMCIAIACADAPESAAAAQPVAPSNRTVEAVIPELIAALQPNWPEKEPAIRALGHIGNNQQPSPFEGTSPPPIDPVAKQRLEEFEATRRNRRETIYGLLQPATRHLLRIARDNDQHLRRLALWALGAIRSTQPDARALVQSIALDAARPSLERQTAIVALSRLSAAEGRAAIASIMAAPNVDPGLFHAAFAALRLLRSEGLPELRALLRDPDPWRRGYAINALPMLREAAAPAAAEAAAALQPELPMKLHESAVRAIAAIAPGDVTTLERVVATSAFSNAACQAAGQSLGQRPGATSFDYRRCAGHQTYQPVSTTPDHIQRALLAAAGGDGNLTLQSTAAGSGVGEHDQSAPQRVIVGCVEPRGTGNAIRNALRDDTATMPAANELRIAAARVTAEDVVLDAVGGLVRVGTTSASCSDLKVDRITDPTVWPMAEMKLSTAQAVGTATTYLEWLGQIDTGTREWRMRVPVLVYHRRADGTVFTDQFTIDPSQNEPSLVGLWSGIEAPLAGAQPSPATRYHATWSSTWSALAPTVVEARDFAKAKWMDIVMYPVDMSGRQRAKPVIPEGLPVAATSGAFVVLPFPPDEDNRRITAYWRKHLSHPHRTIRLTAAAKLAELRDRDSLPAIVGLLESPDAMGQVSAVIVPFGSQAIPLIEPYLKHRRLSVRNAAWATLSRMGPDAVPIYKQVLESGPVADQQMVLKSLERAQPSTAAALVPQLIALLERCDSPAFPMGCYEILDLLTAAGTSAAAAQPVLERRLGNTAGWHQLRTAAALRAVGGTTRATPVIVTMARTGRDSDAENALRHLTTADAFPIFLEVLQRRDAPMAGGVAAAQIGSMKSPPESAWPVVAALARDADPAIRKRVLPALKAFQSPEAIALLGGLMRDPDSEIRRSVYPLLEARGAAALPYVTPLLDDAGNSQRYDLLRFLERLGPAVVTPELIKRIEQLAADERDPSMRNFAGGVLKRLRGVK